MLKAIDYALAAKHDKTLAIHIAVTKEESEALQRQWEKHEIPMPLVIIESPYRTFASPVARVHQGVPREARLVGRHGLPAAVHRRPLVGVAPAQPPRRGRIANQLMLIHGVSITWCRGCSTRPSSSTAAARARFPVRSGQEFPPASPLITERRGLQVRPTRRPSHDRVTRSGRRAPAERLLDCGS